MATPSQIAMMSRLKQAGIAPSDYKGKSEAQLKAMVAKIDGAASPKPKAKSAPVKSAPASVKKAPAKATPAKANAPAKSSPSKATKPAPKRTPAQKVAPAKAKPQAKVAAKPAGMRGKAKATVKSGPGNGTAGSGYERQMIDHKALDWSAEWTGGTRGRRAEVWPMLRKFKGNIDKTVEAYVAKQSGQWFKRDFNKSKDDAIKYLRWFCNRMIFDFATQTGQHQTGTGSNGKPKATGTRRTAAKPQAKAKTTPAKAKAAPARKTAQKATPAKRTPAAKAKPVAKKTAKR